MIIRELICEANWMKKHHIDQFEGGDGGNGGGGDDVLSTESNKRLTYFFHVFNIFNGKAENVFAQRLSLARASARNIQGEKKTKVKGTKGRSINLHGDCFHNTLAKLRSVFELWHARWIENASSLSVRETQRAVVYASIRSIPVVGSWLHWISSRTGNQCWATLSLQ